MLSSGTPSTVRSSVMASDLDARFEAAQLAERLQRARQHLGERAGAGILQRGFLLFGAGFNEGLANVFGFPVDLMAAATRASGVPTPDVPIGGSESIKRLMRGVGLPTRETLRPESGPARFVARVGEEVGAAAVPVGGIGLGLALARRGVIGPVHSALGRSLVRPFKEQPRRALATEAALAVGGGTGAATAVELFPESPSAEVGGTISGSVATALPIAVAQRGLSLALRAAEPFTAAGVERRAARALQAATARPAADIAEELPRTATAVREAIGVTPTSAQAAGDPGLLALERSVSRGTPRAKGELEEIVTAERRAVRRSAAAVIPGGRPEAVSQVLEAQLGQAQAAGQQAIEGAERRIRDAVARLGTADPLEANRVIRQHLGDAERATQELASALFSRVGNVEGRVGRLREAAHRILASRRKAERATDMPAAVPVILKRFGQTQGVESVNELMALRSRLSADIRTEMASAAPNRLKVSRLEQLKEALDDTLIHDFEGVGPVYEEARQFFRREVADRFRRGVVAEVLRAGALGEAGRVPASGIIARFFRAGAGAPEAAQSFQAVLSNNAAARQAMREGVVQQFADFATRADGRFDGNRARQWMTRFKEALKEFPDIRRDVEEIARLGDDAAYVRLGVEKSLQRFQEASLRFFLAAEPDRAVKATLASPRPTEALRTLVEAVRRHPEALQGLRGAVWAQALEHAETRTFDEAIAAGFLSPTRMRQFFERHRQSFLRSGLYTAAEMKRADAVIRAAEIVDRSTLAGLTGGSDTAANLQGLKAMTGLTMPGLWSRFYAIARGVVSPRFIASEVGSRIGQFVLGRITTGKVNALIAQALKDPEVARTLLLRDTEVAPLLLARRLHGHLVNLGPVTLGERRTKGRD